MSGAGSPDGAIVKFEVIAVQGNKVTVQINSNNAAYFEVGKKYEAGVKEKKY